VAANWFQNPFARFHQGSGMSNRSKLLLLINKPAITYPFANRY